jgi:hypothetical protein
MMFQGNPFAMRFFASILLLLATSASAAVDYSITPLSGSGWTGGDRFSVLDVNNSGQVAGYRRNSGDSTFPYHAIWWSGGGTTKNDLTANGNIYGFGSARAAGITDSGLLAVFADNGNAYRFDVVSHLTKSRLLVANPSGSPFPLYFAMSGNGKLLTSYNVGATSRIWNVDTNQLSNAPTVLKGMNFIGAAATYNGGIYDGSSVVEPSVPGLTFGGEAINDSNVVAGTVSDGRAMTFDGQTVTFLPSLPGSSLSSPADLNNDGAVVGTAAVPGTTAAVLWRNGQATELHDLIPTGTQWLNLYTADAISDTGYIVGEGNLDGVRTCYLLTPLPEPSCLVLLLPCVAMGTAKGRDAARQQGWPVKRRITRQCSGPEPRE